jgi:SRSO17 transposase
LVVADSATAPHADGVLVVDDSGDRKAGTKTAHVARQYLGSIGKVDGGIVAVTSLWADERVYYPLHVKPYTPAERLPKGKADPDFRTKPQLAVELVDAARAAGFSFRAIVADCFYGENATFEGALTAAGLPYVVALKPSSGIWAPADAVHTPEEAARELRWAGPDEPGDWTPVVRRFRDGHEETWWAADLCYGPYGPDKARRVVVATTDPATLPPLTTWYLATNLPQPGSSRADAVTFAPADLAEIVRLYGLRHWVEQGYKQLKQELGWADFMVRADQAIRRHWHLVLCAFSFCWRAWFTTGPPPAPPDPPAAADSGAIPAPERGENGARPAGPTAPGLLAPDTPAGTRLARPLDLPLALLARVVERAPAA